MPVSSVSKLACGFVLKRARQRIIDNDGALAFVLYAEAELAEGEGPRVVAEFSDYAGMLDALRRRVNELQLSGERFEEYAGLPRGYLSKLVGARPQRRIGMTSYGPVIAGLGLRCLFVEDNEATQRLKNRVAPRNGSYVRAAPSIVLTVRFFQKIGGLGAQARIDNSTKAQRQQWARHAANTRWAKE